MTNTPTTPTRPTLSPSPSISSRSLPPLTPDFYTPISDASIPTTPPTPSPGPRAYLDQSARRKLSASISSRRKPVPPPEAEYDIALTDLVSRQNQPNTPTTPNTPLSDPFTDHRYATSTLTLTPSMSTPIVDPPRYVLDVAHPPTYHGTNHPYSHSEPSTSGVYVESGLPTPGGRMSREQLPMYAEDVQTEPETLARKCWLWGFLFPFLWLVGMAILCIPLKPTEEEEDVDKAQKLQEMIIILREVELKYARRCAWSFAGFSVLLVGVITLAIVLSLHK